MVRGTRRHKGGDLRVGMEVNPWESGGSHHKGNTAAHATPTRLVYMRRNEILNEGPPSAAHDPEVQMTHLLA